MGLTDYPVEHYNMPVFPLPTKVQVSVKHYEELRGYEARYHQLFAYVESVLGCDTRCSCGSCDFAEKELESHREDGV